MANITGCIRYFSFFSSLAGLLCGIDIVNRHHLLHAAHTPTHLLPQPHSVRYSRNVGHFATCLCSLRKSVLHYRAPFSSILILNSLHRPPPQWIKGISRPWQKWYRGGFDEIPVGFQLLPNHKLVQCSIQRCLAEGITYFRFIFSLFLRISS